MLKLTNLHFKYPLKDWLFRGLEWQIADGRICGLLGKNGVGKTTLLKLVSGLLAPQNGTATVLNSIPHDRDPEFLRAIYFLPEEIWLPNITIKKYIALYAPFYPNFSQQSFFANLKEFELDPTMHLQAVSYGQKKKFILAFALATNSKLLLLDEPSNGLDIPSKSQLRKLLVSNLDEDKTILISTHQVRDLESLLDLIVILDQGKIVLQASNASLAQAFNFINLRQAELATTPNILFQEQIFGGYQVIQENHSEFESQVNLEVLFNAVTTNPSVINAVLQRRGFPL